jgi:hypothetical protein
MATFVKVEATGTINAVITVQVGSQVSHHREAPCGFQLPREKGRSSRRLTGIVPGHAVAEQIRSGECAGQFDGAKANLEKAQATASQAKADYTQ